MAVVDPVGAGGVVAVVELVKRCTGTTNHEECSVIIIL
jgi:hypothetical protein